MERYRVSAGHDTGLGQTPTLHTNDSIPFPPKPHHHLRDPSFPTHLRRLREDSELSIFEAERYFNEGVDDDNPEDDRVQRKDSAAFRRADAPTNPRDSCSLSPFDGGGRCRGNGSHYATPTASSEASWNSRSGLLTNPPGSVAVSVRNVPLSEERKSSATSTCRWLLGRSCPCSGKKAVKVQEKYAVPMSPSHSNFDSIASVSLNKKDSRAGEASVDEVAAALKELEMGSEWEMTKLKLVPGNWIKEQQDLFRDPSDHLSPGKHLPPEVALHRIVRAGKPCKGTGGGAFSFPVLVQTITASPGKPANSVNTQLDDPRRDSLEVFRPAGDATPPKNTVDLQRRAVTQPTLFPMDGGPRRSFTFPPSPSCRVAAVEDDLASDCSSDLFEIESLSTTSYRRRDSLDEPRRHAGGSAAGGGLRLPTQRVPSVAPSECYPPSEASVEWSVATAEGGFGPGSVTNFSSAASDCDNGTGFPPLDHHVFSAAVAGGGGRRRGGGLLSCRSEKAVSVGPNPVRFGAEQRHQLPSDGGATRGRRQV